MLPRLATLSVEAGTIVMSVEAYRDSAIFAAIWIYARYAVAVQACVVETSHQTRSQRSTFLTAGDRGK